MRRRDADPERHLERLRGWLLQLHQAAARERLADSPLVKETLSALDETLSALARALGDLEDADRELGRSDLEADSQARRYMDLFRFAPDAYVVTDERGVVLELNELAEYKFGRRRELLVGKPMLALVVPADRDAFLESLAKLCDRETAIENQSIRFGGEAAPQFDASISALSCRYERRLEFRWILRDITESRRSEWALRQGEARLRAALDVAFDGVIGVDPNGAIQSTNLALRRMFGYRTGELEGRDAAEIGLSRDVLAQMPGRSIREWIGIRSDGSQFPIAVSARATSAELEGAIVSGVRDLSTQRILENQLRSASAATAVAEERERQRLAADLHDDVGQLLSLAGMKLGMLRSAAGDASVKLRDELAELISRAHERTESLTFQLSPPILRDMGLTPALEWLAEDLGRVYGLLTHVEHDGEPPLDEAARLTVFRAVRELLINSAKHAHSGDAAVVLARRGFTLEISVEDRGVGFDPGVPQSGFGLLSIRERLEGLGARFEMESAIDRGTRAKIVVPLLPGGAG